jgi:hypothetical protein
MVELLIAQFYGKTTHNYDPHQELPTRICRPGRSSVRVPLREVSQFRLGIKASRETGRQIPKNGAHAGIIVAE